MTVGNFKNLIRSMRAIEVQGLDFCLRAVYGQGLHQNHVQIWDMIKSLQKKKQDETAKELGQLLLQLQDEFFQLID